MPADGAWNHRSYLDEQEDPRRAHRVHERDEESTGLRKLCTSHSCKQRSRTREQRKTGQRACGECKAKPLHPLAQVIRVGNEGIEAAMRDRIVGPLCPLRVAVQLPRLALGDGFAPDVEQDLVVVHVACKAGRPERDACPEARRRQGAVQEGCGRGGREESSEEETVRRVEGDGGADDGQVGAGPRGCAERRYERAVEVVYEVERDEDKLRTYVERSE